MLFRFGIVWQALYSFCYSEEETLFYIFHDCIHTKSLESTSDMHERESCHSMFTTTEGYVCLYRYPAGKSCYYKSFTTYI